MNHENELKNTIKLNFYVTYLFNWGLVYHFYNKQTYIQHTHTHNQTINNKQMLKKQHKISGQVNVRGRFVWVA